MSKRASLEELSIKRRVWVSVALITLIPVIVIFYYFIEYSVSFFTPTILVLIILLGWWIIYEVFLAIAKINFKTKKVLENMGEAAPAIDNELKSLETVIAVLSSKVKNNFEQLKDFSQKTDELNKEVSKKVLVLSSILQGNDLFSKDTSPEEIVQFLVQRLTEILGIKMYFCSLKSEDSDKFNIASYSEVNISLVESALEREANNLFKLRKTAVLDAENKSFPYASLAKETNINNLALSPIITKGQLVGLLALGNNSEKFIFSADDLSILNLFSQNIALIWEHKKLSGRINELEVFDYLTDLYNEKFIVKRLEEEIERALIYQRPCGFLLMQIANYEEYQTQNGLVEAEKLVKKVARVFRETLRPIDIPARIEPGKFAAILIEKNKRQSQTVTKHLKEKLENIFKDNIKLAFSVAENPIDGTTAQGLISFAQSHISLSKANETS